MLHSAALADVNDSLRKSGAGGWLFLIVASYENNLGHKAPQHCRNLPPTQVNPSKTLLAKSGLTERPAFKQLEALSGLSGGSWRLGAACLEASVCSERLAWRQLEALSGTGGSWRL